MVTKRLFGTGLLLVLVGVFAVFTACKEPDPSSGVDTYTVSFESNGGDSVAPVTVDSGNPITKPHVTKSGHRLVGWFRTVELQDMWNFDIDIVTEDITLYAKWEAVAEGEIVVTFESNGGSSVPDQRLRNGEPVTQPNVSKSGFTLEGWYTTVGFNNGTKWNFSDTVGSESFTLYAKWTQNAPGTFTVTFNSNGGSTVAPQTIASGGMATRPSPNPTRANYTFGDWYSDTGLNTVYNFSTPVTQNITIHAKWNGGRTGDPPPHHHQYVFR